ncbi:hypothetical protein MTR_1g031480 [Medicago truncatula]|uniref:Uncharacterized protein n=1 Tax=Medicago truncatula TaxID=3880 RepID=G7I973_MEDTR|nr:hypothetical protein MTR_1g031480 [Medicago truncatula]
MAVVLSCSVDRKQSSGGSGCTLWIKELLSPRVGHSKPNWVNNIVLLMSNKVYGDEQQESCYFLKSM